MANPVTWAFESLRDRGLRRTALVAVNYVDNWWFDACYGTDTASAIHPTRLAVQSDNKQFGSEYRATKTRPMRQLLHRLHCPTESVFVDFGCGKGKALMIASEFDFRRIVGIDFSPRLCAIARQNIQKYTGVEGAGRIQVCDMDVVKYEFWDDENVLYFYNPFNAFIIEAVLDRLQQSLARRARPVWILYFTPVHREVLDRHKLFELKEHLVLGGSDHLVYINRKFR